MAVVEDQQPGSGGPPPSPLLPSASARAGGGGSDIAGGIDSAGGSGGSTGISANAGPALRPNRSTSANPGPARGPKRSPLVVELSVIVFLGWLYDWLQDLAPLRRDLAFRNGRAVLAFEERIGLAPERALNHWLNHHYVLAYISSDFYDNAIFGVTLALAAWIWWRRPDIYRPLRNDLVLANAIGLVVFWLFPVAPPRMLGGFIDVVEHVGGLGSWHNTLISHADQLAAMPSMHLAWAVWCSLVLWRLASPGPWRVAATALGVAYPLATAWVVMATANHYLADVVAGTGCTVVSALVVEAAVPALRSKLQARRARARPRSPGPTPLRPPDQ